MDRLLRDWANLSPDILRLIAKLLNSAADFIRFGAVCHSWQAVATQSNYTPYSLYQLPWLLLPDSKTAAADTLAFYVLSTKKLVKLKIPDVGNHRVCGACSGWLITTKDGPTPELLNPLCGAIFSLPLPPTSSLFRKIVLSPAMTAVAIHGKRLAFARAGDEEWTSMELDLVGDYVRDVVCYMDGFYVLTYLQMVVACNFGRAGSEEPPRMARVGRIPRVPQLADNLCSLSDGVHIVESEGELLAVVKYMRVSLSLNLNNDENEHRFHVFKLKVRDGDLKARWVEVKNLGKRALFVSSGACMSLSAKLSGCRENSIYFFHGHYPRIEVFSLESRSVVDCYSLGDPSIDYGRNPYKCLYWVTPILW